MPPEDLPSTSRQSPPSLAIILVNWNGHQDAIECLNSLRQMGGRPFTVMVCDNGSTDGSIGAFRAWAKSVASGSELSQFIELGDIDGPSPDSFVTFIEVGENRGFAGGNNVGLRYALALPSIQYFWLLNCDTIVDKGAADYLMDRLDDDQSVGMVGSTLIYQHNRQMTQGLGVEFFAREARMRQLHHLESPTQLPRQSEIEPKISYVIGASLMVTRRFLETVGLMNEEYFLYFEELDWATRARTGANEYRCGWAPRSTVWHKEGASIGSSTTSKPSKTAVYYLARGYLIYYMNFYPMLLPIAVARVVYDGARHLISGDLGLARTTFSGLASGLMHIIRRAKPGYDAKPGRGGAERQAEPY